VWQLEGDTRRIGRRCRQLIAREEARQGVAVSPLSLFEIAALHSSGRLHLALPVEQWIREALVVSGVEVALFSPAAAVDAGQLSREALPDPIDRMLVATARQLDAAVVTGDSRILRFAGQTNSVRIVDATK